MSENLHRHDMVWYSYVKKFTVSKHTCSYTYLHAVYHFASPGMYVDRLLQASGSELTYEPEKHIQSESTNVETVI